MVGRTLCGITVTLGDYGRNHRFPYVLSRAARRYAGINVGDIEASLFETAAGIRRAYISIDSYFVSTSASSNSTDKRSRGLVRMRPSSDMRR